MDDAILGCLREARAACIEARDDRNWGSRELSLVITKIEEAIMWRERDLFLNRPPVNDESGG